MQPIQYSIVIPIFNEEEGLSELYGRLIAVMEKLEQPYEVVFVNDGSTDRSLEIMKGLNSKGRQD